MKRLSRENSKECSSRSSSKSSWPTEERGMTGGGAPGAFLDDKMAKERCHSTEGGNQSRSGMRTTTPGSTERECNSSFSCDMPSRCEMLSRADGALGAERDSEPKVLKTIRQVDSESVKGMLHKLDSIRKLAGHAQVLRRKESRENNTRRLIIEQMYSLLMEEAEFNPQAVRQRNVLAMMEGIQITNHDIFFFSQEEAKRGIMAPSLQLRDAIARPHRLAERLLVDSQVLGRMFSALTTTQIVEIVSKCGEYLTFMQTTYQVKAVEEQDSSQLKNVSGLACCGDAFLVTDAVTKVIWRVSTSRLTAQGNYQVELFAGVPKQPGFQDGPLLRARFGSPNGIVVSEKTHEAFIADTENHAIRRITLKRNFVTTLTIHLSPMYLELAPFEKPKGICIIHGDADVFSEMESSHRRILEVNSKLFATTKSSQGSDGTSSMTSSSSKSSKSSLGDSEDDGVLHAVKETSEENSSSSSSTSSSSSSSSAETTSEEDDALRDEQRVDDHLSLEQTLSYACMKKFTVLHNLHASQGERTQAMLEMLGLRPSARHVNLHVRSLGMRPSQTEAEAKAPKNLPAEVRLAIATDHCVWYVNPYTGHAEVLAGHPKLAGYCDARHGHSARFSSPKAVINVGSVLLVADYWNNVIRCINLYTSQVDTIVDFAPQGPVAICLSDSGVLYALDSDNIHYANMLRITSMLKTSDREEKFQEQNTYESLFAKAHSRASSCASFAGSEVWDVYKQAAQRVSTRKEQNPTREKDTGTIGVRETSSICDQDLSGFLKSSQLSALPLGQSGHLWQNNWASTVSSDFNTALQLQFDDKGIVRQKKGSKKKKQQLQIRKKQDKASVKHQQIPSEKSLAERDSILATAIPATGSQTSILVDSARRQSGERRSSSTRRQSGERRTSATRRHSTERKSSVTRRQPGEQKSSVKRRHSTESKSSVTRRLSGGRKTSMLGALNFSGNQMFHRRSATHRESVVADLLMLKPDDDPNAQVQLADPTLRFSAALQDQRASMLTKKADVCVTVNFTAIADNQWSEVTWLSPASGNFNVGIYTTAGRWGTWGKRGQYRMEMQVSGEWADVPGHDQGGDVYEAKPHLEQIFSTTEAITGVRLSTPTWRHTDSEGIMTVRQGCRKSKQDILRRKSRKSTKRKESIKAEEEQGDYMDRTLRQLSMIRLKSSSGPVPETLSDLGFGPRQSSGVANPRQRASSESNNVLHRDNMVYRVMACEEKGTVDVADAGTVMVSGGKAFYRDGPSGIAPAWSQCNSRANSRRGSFANGPAVERRRSSLGLSGAQKTVGETEDGAIVNFVDLTQMRRSSIQSNNTALSNCEEHGQIHTGHELMRLDDMAEEFGALVNNNELACALEQQGAMKGEWSQRSINIANGQESSDTMPKAAEAESRSLSSSGPKPQPTKPNAFSNSKPGSFVGVAKAENSRRHTLAVNDKDLTQLLTSANSSRNSLCVDMSGPRRIGQHSGSNPRRQSLADPNGLLNSRLGSFSAIPGSPSAAPRDARRNTLSTIDPADPRLTRRGSFTSDPVPSSSGGRVSGGHRSSLSTSLGIMKDTPVHGQRNRRPSAVNIMPTLLDHHEEENENENDSGCDDGSKNSKDTGSKATGGNSGIGSASGISMSIPDIFQPETSPFFTISDYAAGKESLEHDIAHEPDSGITGLGGRGQPDKTTTGVPRIDTNADLIVKEWASEPSSPSSPKSIVSLDQLPFTRDINLDMLQTVQGCGTNDAGAEVGMPYVAQSAGKDHMALPNYHGSRTASVSGTTALGTYKVTATDKASKTWRSLKLPNLLSAMQTQDKTAIPRRYPNTPLAMALFESNGESSIFVGLLCRPNLLKIIPPKYHEPDKGGRFNVLPIDGHRVLLADESSHQIRLLKIGGTKHLAGCGKRGFLDGPLDTCRMNSPCSMTIDPSSHYIYVADRGNHVIRKIDLTSGLMSTVVGNGTCANCDGSSPRRQALNSPFAVAFVKPHYLIISCSDNSIKSFNLKTNYLKTILVGS